ncbi:hypothetical protein DFJ68_0772 [Terracoccus luteus]|uniref:ATP synthase protein I n=1 Tax=Terracoccus luteus TaxID=53356 RepID=A0A495XS29_9MICO|nr:hypothetical protein [Terracoccus luteus]RKT77351.1 hypothetical protein DFJ68_0772 [Terracoccus luteus]
MPDRTSPEAQAAPIAFSVILRGALPVTVVAGLVTAVVIALVSGLSAGVAALIGVVIAVVFFASGVLIVSRVVVDTSNPVLFMAVGMAVYLAQIIVMFGVLLVARQVQSFDSVAAGIAILVCVVVWQAAQMRAWRRARVPVYDAVAMPGESGTDETVARPAAGDDRGVR